MPLWQQRVAGISHLAMYACMLLMPLSGYVGSNFSKHGVKFFGQTLAPWGPDNQAVYDALNRVHVVTGWLFAVLIAGHVLAALQHARARDGVMRRIVPWLAAPPADPIKSISRKTA